MKLTHLYLIATGCALMLGLSGCNLFQRDAKEGSVVQLGNNYLYQSDIDAITAYASTAEDSIRYAEQFVRRWATDILMYQQGKSHSSADIEVWNLYATGKKKTTTISAL